MPSNLTATLYRELLRQVRQFGKKIGALEFRKPLTESWGYCHRPTWGQAYSNEAMHEALPFMRRRIFEFPLSGKQMMGMVREEFRSSAPTSPTDKADMYNRGFLALRTLGEQQYLALCSTSITTEGITVEATSAAVSDQPQTTRGGEVEYRFTYRLRVINRRQDPIKVLGREWEFLDGGGQCCARILLDRNAVVGQQPRIPPGDCFEYYSGTILNTPEGLMKGRLLVELPATEPEQGSVEIVTDKFTAPLLQPSQDTHGAPMQ